MKPDYTEFDKALIAAIQDGCKTAMVLEGRMRALAEPFRVRDRWGHLTPEFRVIDRRLQALRKAGKISFNGKHWVVL